MKIKDQFLKGIRPEDGCAHDHHHQGMGRRDFLTNLGLLTGGTVALSGMPVHSLIGAPLLSRMVESAGDRVLVIIRLKGGNDGLNTFVPVFDYSTYASFRPNLKINQSNLLHLNDKYAVPDFASSLRDMWNDGQMKIIHNVGYENHDLSHFVSTDIFDSASTAIDAKSGWLGRYLWDQNPDYLTNPPTDPLAIQVGGDGNILFFNEDSLNMAMNVVNPEDLYNIAQTGSVYTVNGNAACYYDDQLDFLKGMINSTFTQSESIKVAYDAGSNATSFPAGLGQSLSLVSRLIKGGLSTKIYMLTIDGFDTHASQDIRHPLLLTELADSVKAFFADLSVDGKDQHVLCMTFSEFGRRVFDNFSQGTDHGTAAPLMLFGPALDGHGFIGNDVNLNDLDFVSNLKHDIDFRQVYTTVLQDWLCTDELIADNVLGGSYARLSLGFNCNAVSAASYETAGNLHQLRYDHESIPFVHLRLTHSSNVKLEAYDVLGRKLASTNNEYFSAGTHNIEIPDIRRWTTGTYVYKLFINGKLEAGKLQKY